MSYFNDIETFAAAISLGTKKCECNLCGKKHQIKESRNQCEYMVYDMFYDLKAFTKDIAKLLQKITETIMQKNTDAKRIKNIADINGIKLFPDYSYLKIHEISYNNKFFKALPYLRPSESFKHLYDFFHKNEKKIKEFLEECHKYAEKIEEDKYWTDVEKALFNIIKSKEFQVRLINNLLDITPDPEIKVTYFYPIKFEWPFIGLMDSEILIDIDTKKDGFSYITKNEFLGLDRVFESINMRQFIRTANVKFINADIIDGGYKIALLIYPPETSGKPDINVRYKCSFLGEVTDIVWSEIPSSKEMTVHQKEGM